MRVAWYIAEKQGAHPAVLGESGRLYTPLVYLDSGRGVRVERIENRAAAKLEGVKLNRRPYPVRRAALLLLRYGRTFGISAGARELLKQLAEAAG